MMKVKVYTVFVSTTLAFAFLLCLPVSLPAQSNGHSIKTIVIDPGHGGYQPGTVWGKSSEITEKEIVLNIALELGAMIKKNLPDVKVLYTRDKDKSVDLSARGDLANKAKADLFISLHVNALDKTKVSPSGALTLVMGTGDGDKNFAEAKRENEAILYEENYEERYSGYNPNSPESFMIFSMMQYVNTEQSMSFAEILQKHYKNSGLFPDLGVRQQPVLVLWKATMPRVLTEMGFMTNDRDRKLITSKDGQKKIATAIFNAISEYKAKVEKNSRPVILETEVYVDGTTTTSPGSSLSEKPAFTYEQATLPVVGNTSSQVIYRIQICSVPRKLSESSRELKPFKGRITERKSGTTYKYYVGGARTYNEALELQKEVRKHVKDAFMVAFRGDTQITASEARKITK